MEEDKIIAMHNVYIPDETVIEILKRVPAKSLMRFRCVSKYFCSLISESSFIEAHHKSLVAQFFLLNRVALIPKHVIYNLSQREEDQDLANCPLRYLDEPCFRNLRYMHSINGLVCLWNHKGDVAICNPFIKEHVFLPKAPHIEKVSDSTTYLFGLDPTTKKHKVLMEYMAPYEYRSRVKYWIFTIGVDKSWREISGWTEFFSMKNCVCINGLIYCEIFFRRDIAVFSIITGEEKLIRMIALPYRISMNTLEYIPKIVEIKGQVALLVNDKDFQVVPKILLYVLNGTSETDVWVKHRIELPLELTKTSLFTANSKGEIVSISDTETSHVFLYDIGIKKWRKVEIHRNYKQECRTDTISVLLNLVESIWPLR
ncbi:putative F-box protein At1g32420 [Lycium ferocissimum]|uniref:putative F-box protein At1g32420 n=1 Tax=Lycium ferocissimum TaxID=112874 RepID=UPI002815DA60|nr:putative F-box protein At1g32420 [Lycium ferocissimum]